MQIVLVSEAMRMFLRSLRVRLEGWKNYSGNAGEICRAIISDCWNGRYFQTSSGHFCEFYCRDFSWCTKPLLTLGYGHKVKKTLDYALSIFSKHDKITTTISPKGMPFDAPVYGPDSLASVTRSLSLLNDKKLVLKHKEFLNREISKFFELVIEKNTGLVKKKHFSSIKDLAIRGGSCYDNVMVAMLKNDLGKLKVLDNPFKEYNLKKIIKEYFWTGEYFLDSLSSKKRVSGDANVFPFWSGVFDSKKMLKKAVASMCEANLDKSFPLRYTFHKSKEKLVSQSTLVPNYEGNTIWAHLGMLYLTLLKKADKNSFEEHLQTYTDLVEGHKTFFEVYTPEGKVYKTLFYYADEGMLWASIFLELYGEAEKR